MLAVDVQGSTVLRAQAGSHLVDGGSSDKCERLSCRSGMMMGLAVVGHDQPR